VSCIFCRIIAKEIPSQVVREEKTWIAIRDVQPQAPQHILLLPREHLAGLPACDASHQALLGELLRGAAEIARTLGIETRGYRVVVNTGQDGGQSVGHLHLHLLGGRSLAWPPG
jgi:histidine triad (HIT) family protein